MTQTPTKPRRARQTASSGRLSGPRSRFRHKVRSPVSLLLTESGHEKMNKELERTGLSRSDFFETLLMDYGQLVKPIKAAELLTAAGGT